jgi:iron complex outermembrane recepter protein
MKTKSNKLHLAVLQTLGASIAMGVVAQANAQASAKVEKIEVTGSNIKRVDQEGPSPVVVIKREDIEKSGATSVSELLRSITAQSGGSFDERTFGSFAPGSAGISLRGLGQSATLVLVNGRRVAGYGFAQNAQDAFVDLNSLPLGAVERIEILKDGASAVYGSDAIAGVINVILRKDYQGFELSAFYGGANSQSQTKRGWDAKETKLSATAGFGDIAKDRYNVLASVDYFERTHVILKDRKFSRTADLRSRGGVDSRSPSSPTGTVFNYSTGLYQALPGCPAADLQVSAGGTICKFNFNDFATVIPGAKRIGLTTRGNIELAPTLSLFADFSYNDSKSHSEFAPVPSGTYFAAGAPGNPIPAANVFALRRLIEFGPRLADNESKTTRALAGFKGNNLGWDWETAYSYSKSDVESNDGNRVRADLLRAAIANGTFQFGRLNPSSVVEPLRFTPNAVRKGVSTYKSFDVKGSTEITQLAGGTMGLAVGAERRSQSISDVPDIRVVQGLSSRETATAAAGSRNEWSVYAETIIPFAKGWEAQIAVRHDAYQGTDSSTNPKFAMSWRPISDILVRASYSTGFRAPGLQELFLAPTTSQVTIVDGVRCRAGVAAACAGTQTNARLGGNPKLKPEDAKSYNIGFVWDVTKSFSAGVDFYRIEQKNKISSNPQFIVDNEANPPAGASVVRAPSPGGGVPGRITTITAPYINVSSQEVQGTDLDLTYRMSLGEYGRLILSSSFAYYDYLKQASTPTARAVNIVGTGTSGFSFPRVRNRNQAEWTVGNWNNVLVMSRDSAYKEDDVARLATVAGAVREVAAYTTFDTQVAYSGYKGFKLIGGIRNLLDKDPPFKANSTEGYDVERDNPRGRFFYVQVNYAFK